MKHRGKRPAYQHYPGDEQRDSSVQMLGLAEFGLWRRMLNLMHDGAPYGHLTTASGDAIEPKDLARLVGEPVASVVKYLKRLEGLKVFSRNESGVIYSRRMVRDEHNRNVRAAGGPKSLENENVPRPKDHGKDGRKGTFEGSFGGSPASAVAVCGLQSASEEHYPVSEGESSSKRSSSHISAPSRPATDTAAPLRSLALEQLTAELTPAVRQFVAHFYGRAHPDRQRDVVQQLVSLQRGESVLDDKRQPVRAYSIDRLESKCRAVVLATLRDPNAATAVLLIKLGDTSDLAGSGALPGQVDAKALAPSGPLDERVTDLIAGVAYARTLPAKPLSKPDR